MSDLRSLLLQGHNKEIRDEVIDYVGNDESRMSELMDLFFGNETKIAQRAAWSIGEISRYKACLVNPYLVEMYQQLQNPVHDAIKRNTLRAFQDGVIPEELEGRLFEMCIQFLNDTKEPVAIRVYSMNILTRLASKFPALKNELIEVIDLHYNDGTAGFQSAARRNLKILQKL